MLNCWRMATRLWQACVVKILLGICAFVVACRAMALVVVHQIFTSTRVAGSFWAIRNVSASLLAIGDFLLVSAVALAVVVIVVVACWSGVIDTLPIWATLVPGAIVLVEATSMRALLTISHTCSLEPRPTTTCCQWLGESAVNRETKRARKFHLVAEDDSLLISMVIRVSWHHHFTALHGFAPVCVAVILSRGHTFKGEAVFTTDLGIHRVTPLARVRFDLPVSAMDVWMQSLCPVWRCSASHRLEDLPALVTMPRLRRPWWAAMP